MHLVVFMEAQEALHTVQYDFGKEKFGLATLLGIGLYRLDC